jgi:hypothetical protein
VSCVDEVEAFSMVQSVSLADQLSSSETSAKVKS